MENELVDLVMEDTRERMLRAIEHVKSEFAAVRTGRANSTLIEGLLIDYYGTDTPLKQLANFSVPEPRLLVVSPFDKGSMAAIEKAISQRRPRSHPVQRRRGDPSRLSRRSPKSAARLS